jgi:hypothetical protein
MDRNCLIGNVLKDKNKLRTYRPDEGRQKGRSVRNFGKILDDILSKKR